MRSHGEQDWPLMRSHVVMMDNKGDLVKLNVNNDYDWQCDQIVDVPVKQLI